MTSGHLLGLGRVAGPRWRVLTSLHCRARGCPCPGLVSLSVSSHCGSVGRSLSYSTITANNRHSIIRRGCRPASLSSTTEWGGLITFPLWGPQERTLLLFQPVLASPELCRYLHSSQPLRDGEPPTIKPSSKVEETTKVLTDEMKEKKDGTAVALPKRPLWKRVQDEILHYYHGFRLLFIDVKISAKLIWRILNGKTLSRREHKQLIRTTSDLFRLVPFSVFIIVPFMELLLPVFLKLFPGMLPSTFQTKSDRETKMKAELKVKLDMAKFLQETLDEMAPQAKGRSSQTAKEFAEFITKIRGSGYEVTNEEIMKFSKLFEDEITLDSLSRPQLLALCRLLEIPAYGPTPMLRFQLRMRLRNLAADDQMIEAEGLDALNHQELQTACKARGMRAVGVTEERLKRQLEQWLQLSLHQKLPPSLLLLSRAMYLPDTLPAPAQLQATLCALPEGTALQTKATIGEREGKIDHKTRIQLIREEERLIKEEQQEAKKIRKEEEQAKKQKEEMPLDTAEAPAPDGPADWPAEARAPSTTLPFREPTPLVSELGPSVYYADPLSVLGAINNVLSRKHIHVPVTTEDKLTAKDFEAIEDAIEKLSRERKELLLEKEELLDLKQEMKDYKEDVQFLETVVKQAGEKKLQVSKGAKRLFNKLETMISELEKTVDTSDTTKTGEKCPANVIATEELIAALRNVKMVEEDPAKVDRIAGVLAKLDDNKDGKIEMDDLVKVIEIVGRENVHMTTKQLEEIVSVLAKEECLEKKSIECLDKKNDTPPSTSPTQKQ